MAYRNDIGTRDRGGAIAAVVAIHAGLLFALLHLSGRIDLTDTQTALQTFDFGTPPPPPPPPRQQVAKPKDREGGSAPKNIRSEATPVVAPLPKIKTPPVQKTIAAETPRQGTAPTQGAADVRGPGTGAGGSGNGTGSGSGGNGPGGGGGIADPPRLISPVLRGRDFPPQITEQWPGGATVFMRLRVNAEGVVSECTVDRGTGNPAIDNALCNVVHDRLRFRPAVNRSGQAVAGWFGYAQPAPR